MIRKKTVENKPAKKRVASKGKRSLAVKERIQTYEGWKRKKISERGD